MRWYALFWSADLVLSRANLKSYSAVCRPQAKVEMRTLAAWGLVLYDFEGRVYVVGIDKGARGVLPYKQEPAIFPSGKIAVPETRVMTRVMLANRCKPHKRGLRILPLLEWRSGFILPVPAGKSAVSTRHFLKKYS